ncbi:tetratricopeptide repeat protein [Phaeobacter sp. C3_T13_0]|uniref:O-linked N-acetylglucosamine transferase, SPINDLY family protein n=1 Tax=Phaeobacter cretensis TaxID=3342641 RepID=UPI0039BD23FE
MNKPLRKKNLSKTSRRGEQKKAVSPLEILLRASVQAIAEGDTESARGHLSNAIIINPNDSYLHGQMAALLIEEEEYDKALLSLMQALKLEPGNPKWFTSIGTLLLQAGRPSDAVGFFEAVYQLDPENTLNVVRMLHTQMDECNWVAHQDRKNKLRIMDNAPALGDRFPTLLYVDDAGFQKKRAVAKAKNDASLIRAENTFNRTPAKDRKIRIGYFSSDFYHHATMFLMVRHFELHDCDNFEIFIYDYSVKPADETRQRVMDAVDCYRSVTDMKDADIAALAREDGIDIAIDMKGFTNGGRLPLFAFRAAPVQVSYLGYPSTTGMRTMDYFLADPITVPKDLRRHFSEKILYMPNCYQVNDNTREHPVLRPTRAEVGLPENAVVFSSFNNPNKVTPVEFDIWMDLLKEVDESVLWFLAPSEQVKTNIRKEAETRGVPANRIVFADRCTTDEHLARLPLADIFLDTFICNAHTTASEVLWSGVPVVTMPGQQFAARVAASIVTAAGCPELAVETTEDYRNLALRLATTPEERQALREKLMVNIRTTPLYDTEQYVRDFEALMAKAIQRYDDGLKPDHLGLTEGKV